MHSGDRIEFTKTLRVLCAARGIPWTEERDEAFWKGLAKMSLLQLQRAVDAMCEDEEPPRNLMPAQVWQAHRSQRAAATPPAQMPASKWNGDNWDIVAAYRLLRHITGILPRDPSAFGRGASAHAMKTLRTPNADASREFIEKIESLVAAKNRWAQIMRDSADADGVPVDEQNDCWRACLANAVSIRLEMQPQEALF